MELGLELKGIYVFDVIIIKQIKIEIETIDIALIVQTSGSQTFQNILHDSPLLHDCGPLEEGCLQNECGW